MKEDINSKLAQMCTFGNTKLIVECIHQGANVNYNRGYAGKVAIVNDKLNVLKLLLNYGFNELEESLLQATRAQKHEMMKFLINEGADVHYAKEACLVLAVEKKDLEAFQVLIDNKANVHVFNEKLLMVLLAEEQLSNHESQTRKIFNLLLEKINVHTFDAETIFINHVDAGTFYYKAEELALSNLDIVINYVNAKKESLNIETMLTKIEETRAFELENLGMDKELEELVKETQPKKRNKI
jgi:hypothetical protein